jgi:AraC-like DNA-binding protein
MSKREADRFVLETQNLGFQHHPYFSNRERLLAFLDGKIEDDASVFDGLKIDTYSEILAPGKLRAERNSLICLAAIVSRTVIEKGVNPEISFSMSDYYINEVEKLNTEREIYALVREMMQQYAKLVREASFHGYSTPVNRAIRYIKGHLAGPCRVKDIAASVKLNRKYFAAIFKAETGSSPAAFIRREKMAAALTLLSPPGRSVAETAETLGYCDSSHFIREFRKVYGKTPGRFIRD